MMGLFFEELKLGSRFELGHYNFTDDNIRRFKERFAPVPFHMDEETAAEGLFGRMVAVGFHTCAAWMPCFVEANSGARAGLLSAGRTLPDIGAGLGLHDIQWPRPVLAGDRVNYRTTVAALRDFRSKPAWGLLETLNEGFRGTELVVRFTSRMMVAKGGPDQAVAARN